MKITVFRPYLAASLILAGACSAPPSQTNQAGPQSAISVGPDDLKKCEDIVRLDLQDHQVALAHYSAELKDLVTRGYSSTHEDGLSVYNADHRFRVQDGTPDILSVGPSKQSGYNVYVPVDLKLSGVARYRVTWILSRGIDGQWEIKDLIASGGWQDGSLAETLKELLN